MTRIPTGQDATEATEATETTKATEAPGSPPRRSRPWTGPPGGSQPRGRAPLGRGWWLSVLAIAGCTATFQPMGPPIAPPSLRDDAVTTADGYRLPLRVWRPDGPIKALLLALHGFNDYANAYADSGPAFARAGILTYAYDQRGFGAARNPGIWPGSATLIADFETVAGLLVQRHPGVPLYVLGESMGGAVVMAALARPSTRRGALNAVRGAVLVAPAVWGHATMALVPRVALWLTNTLAPAIAMTAPRALNIRPSDNVEMLRRYARDPLVIKSTRVDAMNGLVELMGEALAAAPRFCPPALILYGVNEQVLPRNAVISMLENLHPEGHRVAIYPNGWHMLLRDRQGKTVVNDIVSWMNNPDDTLPSGSDRVPYTRIASH